MGEELGLNVEEVNPRNFPLPSLALRLRSLVLELHNGRGFFVLRGLDLTKYLPEDNTLIYVAIASHIAGKRGKQNEDGDIFSMHLILYLWMMYELNDWSSPYPRSETDGRVTA